jgi:hypothetical protein
MQLEASADTERASGAKPVVGPPTWWREVLYILGFYVLYAQVRNLFGSGSAADAQQAFANAMTIVDAQRAIGLFVEPTLQGWFLDWHRFIQFWNIFYGTAHFIVTPIALFWLFRRDAATFRRWRNTIFLASALALIGYSLFPLMPPRLLNEPPERMGGAPYATEDFGFVDTMSVYDGLWSFDDETVQRLSNQYAAMPSLHMGWSTWCALVLVPRARKRISKVAAALYPVAMLFCIVVTANHFWLDAVGGWAVLAGGYLIARYAVPPLADRVLLWRERRRPTTAGPAA